MKAKVIRVRSTLSATKKEIKILERFLKDELSTRQAGKLLGVSHQSIINLSVVYIKQRISEKTLKL